MRDLWIPPVAAAALLLLVWLAGLSLPSSRRIVPTLHELRRGRCWHVVHRVFGMPDLVMSRHYTPAGAARRLKHIGFSDLVVIQAPRPIRRRAGRPR